MSVLRTVGSADVAYSIVPLLRGMMNASEGHIETAPDVNVNSVNAFINPISLNLTYSVDPNPTGGAVVNGGGTVMAYDDVVAFNSGMYLSLPQESHESIFHMGFVPAGAARVISYTSYEYHPGAATRGLDIRPHYFGPNQVAGNLNNQGTYNAYRLTYISELALPRVGYGAGITIQPDIKSNYSKVRAFASDFKISSTTISGANFNLAGTFSTGVVADTRYISQTISQNGVRRAYPAAALKQQSVTKPDDLTQSSVAKGVIDIMGPDYPRRWCPTDVDSTDTLDSEWQTFEYAAPNSSVIGFGNFNAQAIQGLAPIAQLWVCSTDTEFYVSDKSALGVGLAPAMWQKIYYGSINEDGVLDINLRARVSCVGQGSDAVAPANFILYCNFIHVYAYVAADGIVSYNLQSETQSQLYSDIETIQAYSLSKTTPGVSNFTVATTLVPDVPVKTFMSRPRMLRNGMNDTTGGKYLGTLCTLSTTSSGPAFTGTNSYIVSAYDSTLQVRARNVNAPGRVGPAHIIRYDGVAVGQQLNFVGTTILQGVAQGNLAPFINSNGAVLTVPDSLFSKFVDILWTMSPKFKRIASLEDYDKNIRPFFQSLTTEGLLHAIGMLDEATAITARAIGRSAGFLPYGTSGGAGPAMGQSTGYIASCLGGMAAKGLDRFISGTSSAQYNVHEDGHGASYIASTDLPVGSRRQRG